MAEKIKQHFIRRKFFYILSILVVTISIGAYFVIDSSIAKAVSSVTLADNDTTGYGLDGRDFTVTWTPGTEPAGYESTIIYITDSTLTLAAGTIETACTGTGDNSCQPRGYFMHHDESSWTLMEMATTDSNAQTFSVDNDYKAWVYTSSTVPTIAGSSAVDYASAADTPTDTNAPQIDHISVHSAQASANAIIHAFVYDDQTTTANFANTSDGRSEYITLVYGADVSTAAASSTASQVTGDLFSFTVPSATVGAAANTFEYYIVANDNDNNIIYVCSDFSANSAAECQASPFVTTAVASGSISVSGKITSASSNLASAKVFAGGYAKAAVDTDASGDYSITGLPSNTAFDITAGKSGYCDMSRFETIGTSNLTAINMDLYQGSCGYHEGEDEGSPMVNFTNPPDGSQFASVDSGIRVGLSQTMDSNTINDVEASDGNSDNVYLTTDDGTTKVAGQVTYCSDNTASGCSSVGSGDTNVILFSPTSDLSTATFYSLVITSSVLSENAQAIEGNRAGGGHQISFTTTGDTWDTEAEDAGTNYGSSGGYMPPYVRSVTPAPGQSVSPNTTITAEFNEAMNSSTITAANFTVQNVTDGTAVTLTSISLDTNENRFVSINPGTLTAGKQYELRVKGAVANMSGMTIGSPSEASNNVFSSSFEVAGDSDTTAPTIYPMLANNSTGVSVNEVFEFGFSEPMDVSTVNISNITLRRGSTSVSKYVEYDLGANSVFVIPTDVLAPNTVYSITFSTSVTDLAGVALASATTYSYTTGSADTTAPEVREARCDDYTCTVFFTEGMNHDSQAGSSWATSVINPSNWTVQRTSPDVAVIDVSGRSVTYDDRDYSATIEGVSGLAASNGFRVTIGSTVTDLSGNAIATASSQNIFNGTVESSGDTYGDFGGGGMFGPPIAGGGAAGSEFIPEGFGSFTSEQFMFGQADMAFPFNQMAGQDCNVFQVRFTPGQVLQNDDQVVLTFPNGTTITNAAPDTFSPFHDDFNEFGSGTITFDTALDTDGVSVDTTTREVTVQLAITGTPDANDAFTIDLRSITNPLVPKGPESGGYTLGIKVLRSGSTIINKTSMPYFINESGTNTITVNIYAGTATSTPTAGADGDVFMFGGGPAGPMDKNVTLTDGEVSAVDGSAATSIAFTSLPDGCYHFGTDPFVSLGGSDYFGMFSPEPVCVDSGASATKEILLTPSSGTNSATVTVKLSGIADFGGVDIDVFAGGPGRFVVKTLSSVGAPNAAGYDLQLPSNGNWFVGVGPAMPKGPSAGKMVQLPGVAPPPIDLIVSGIGGTPAVTTGFQTPPGASFDDDNDIVTFTFAAADKTITGTVTDGTNNLANIEVFVHQHGFGAPMFDTTDNDGAFSINVSDYGSYEIGAFKEGLPPNFKQIEVRNVSDSAVIYFKGKQITGGNPLVLTLKKPDWYISGKILDSSGNGISYAPVFATDANGNFVSGGTGSDGSYTIFVANGTWTVRSELPPEKTDTCGTFSRTVTVNGANQTSQNISPSGGTCYTLSGTVSVGGTGLANVPVFIEEWDTVNNHPAPGGAMKGSGTDSDGAYSVKAGNGTYRIGTWHPDYGELSATATVNGANVTDGDVTVASTATITFTFTGGSADMDAFVELKNNSDKTKRIGKQHNGLNSDLEITVPASQTFNYFVDVFGFGDFSGTADSGDTVTIDVSTSDFITVSGNIKDADDNNLSGALVTFSNDDTDVVETALTDSNGDYTINVKADTYTIGASIAGYVPAQASQEATLAETTTNYDFGGAAPDQTALAVADSVISGTLNDSTGTAMTEAYVWAEDTNGIVVEAAIDPDDGTYSLPVTDGTWTVKAAGPLHDETTMSATVAIASADSADNDFNLTANADKLATSTSGLIAANTGGSLDDTDSSGIKITTGSGVLETGSGNVTMNLERNYTAPDSESFEALSNATFEITATGNSTIKNLNGNAEIQFDYTDLVGDLPSGTTEDDLQLVYYSPERGDYVPVEGGFTIDAANNTVTGLVDHFSEFALVYASSGSAPSTPSGLSATANGSSQVNLSWNEVSGATSYDIYRSTSSGGTFARLGSEPTVSSGSTTTYTDTGLSGATTYYYKVSALNGNGESAASSAVSATTVATPAGAGSSGAASTPPTNTSIVINSGAAATNSLVVELSLSATNAIQMAISNSSNFSGVSWEDYAVTKTWTLASGDGTRRVYAKFRDAGGDVSSAVSDSIQVSGSGTVAEAETPVAEVEISDYEGKLVKYADSSAVYLIQNNKKRVFINANAFLDNGYKWDDIVTVSKTQTYSDGENIIEKISTVALAEGSLFKYADHAAVYLIQNAKKRVFINANAFLDNGYKWDDIVTVSKTQTYSNGENITAKLTATPTASGVSALKLIKYASSPKIYCIDDGKKRYIVDANAFGINGFKWVDVKVIPETEQYEDGANIIGKVEGASASFKFTRFLSIGNTGQEVKMLQAVLRELGYFDYSSDTGYFGSVTREAVKKFQADNGIQAVGYVGPQTRAKLQEFID